MKEKSKTGSSILDESFAEELRIKSANPKKISNIDEYYKEMEEVYNDISLSIDQNFLFFQENDSDYFIENEKTILEGFLSFAERLIKIQSGLCIFFLENGEDYLPESFKNIFIAWSEAKYSIIENINFKDFFLKIKELTKNLESSDEDISRKVWIGNLLKFVMESSLEGDKNFMALMKIIIIMMSFSDKFKKISRYTPHKGSKFVFGIAAFEFFFSVSTNAYFDHRGLDSSLKILKRKNLYRENLSLQAKAMLSILEDPFFPRKNYDEGIITEEYIPLLQEVALGNNDYYKDDDNKKSSLMHILGPRFADKIFSYFTSDLTLYLMLKSTKNKKQFFQDFTNFIAFFNDLIDAKIINLKEDGVDHFMIIYEIIKSINVLKNIDNLELAINHIDLLINEEKNEYMYYLEITRKLMNHRVDNFIQDEFINIIDARKKNIISSNQAREKFLTLCRIILGEILPELRDEFNNNFDLILNSFKKPLSDKSSFDYGISQNLLEEKVKKNPYFKESLKERAILLNKMNETLDLICNILDKNRPKSSLRDFFYKKIKKIKLISYIIVIKNTISNIFRLFCSKLLYIVDCIKNKIENFFNLQKKYFAPSSVNKNLDTKKNTSAEMNKL